MDTSDRDKLDHAGYQVKKAEKALDPGIADVLRRLGRDADGRVGIIVAERYVHLIKEFFGCQSDDIGSPGAEDDCLDALRYAVHGYDEGDQIETWSDSSNPPSRTFDIKGKVGSGRYSR